MKRIFSFLVCFVSIIMLASCSKDYKVTVHKPEEPIYNIITANYLKVVESIEEFEILIEYNDNLNDFKNDYDEEFFKENTLIIVLHDDYAIEDVSPVKDGVILKFIMTLDYQKEEPTYYFYEFSKEYMNDITSVIAFTKDELVSEEKHSFINK